MIENSIEIFNEHVLAFMIGRSNIANSRGIIKKHTENLQTHGDFSFPNISEPWNVILIGSGNFSNKDPASILFHGKNLYKIVAESTSWNLKVKHLELVETRIYMFLDRPLAIPVGLSEGLRNSVLLTQRLKTKNTSVIIDTSAQSNCLTSLRVNYVSKVIGNLCAISEKSPDILVTSRSTITSTDRRVVLCMPVLNAVTGSKEVKIRGIDFIRSRQAEMGQKAQRKYGAGVFKDLKWKGFLAHLGESAVAFELLQGKPSSAIKINFNLIGNGASKGASFVLYNCARLETVIRKYNEKVEEGTYPPSPCFEEINFDLLTLEDEWSLIFNYILGFPSMITQCVEIDGENCQFRPHLICTFLSSMARTFSQYYRRTKILVEPRNHLLPLIYARIEMLKILNDTIKTCLSILNINSVSRM